MDSSKLSTKKYDKVPIDSTWTLVNSLLKNMTKSLWSPHRLHIDSSKLSTKKYDKVSMESLWSPHRLQ